MSKTVYGAAAMALAAVLPTSTFAERV